MELRDNNNEQGIGRYKFWVGLWKHLFGINGYSYQLELAHTGRMEIKLESAQIVDRKANICGEFLHSSGRCVPLQWSWHKIILYSHPTIFTGVIADNVSHCDGTHTKCGRYLHLSAKVWVLVDHHVSHCDEVRAIVLDSLPTIFTEVIADYVSHCNDTRTKCWRYLQKNWLFRYWIEITLHSWQIYVEGL